VGYTRVITVAQTLDQQNAALESAGVTKTFSDIMSGARDDRPGLAALMDYVRPGDTVVVWKLDRLGRNMIHILQTVKELTDRSITLVSTTDGIDSSTAAGRMMIGVLTVFRDRDSCRAISACDNFSDLCSWRISAQSSTVITLQSKGAHFSTGITCSLFDRN